MVVTPSVVVSLPKIVRGNIQNVFQKQQQTECRKHREYRLYEEKDQKNEEKNLETTLLIDPSNEEAILMMMQISIEKSNYSKVKELSKRFSKVCKNLCKENDKILKELQNLEPKNNES